MKTIQKFVTFSIECLLGATATAVMLGAIALTSGCAAARQNTSSKTTPDRVAIKIEDPHGTKEVVDTDEPYLVCLMRFRSYIPEGMTTSETMFAIEQKCHDRALMSEIGGGMNGIGGFSPSSVVITPATQGIPTTPGVVVTMPAETTMSSRASRPDPTPRLVAAIDEVMSVACGSNPTHPQCKGRK